MAERGERHSGHAARVSRPPLYRHTSKPPRPPVRPTLHISAVLMAGVEVPAGTSIPAPQSGRALMLTNLTTGPKPPVRGMKLIAAAASNHARRGGAAKTEN